MLEDETLKIPLIAGEKILWSIKPKKSAFVINKILAIMPFVLICLLIDSAYISINGQDLFFIFAFYLVLQALICIGNYVIASKKWENTKYYMTDKRIIIQTSIIGANYQTTYYKDIKDVELRIGIVDSILGVGDIYINTVISNKKQNIKNVILYIKNPYEIYSKLQKIILDIQQKLLLDIQTDLAFPNDYKPSDNPGYNTKYKG